MRVPGALQPLTRLLLLLVIAPALGSLPLVDLAVLAAGLVLGYRQMRPEALQRLGQGLLRLRWLLLSIWVLYLGFTPGTPLSPWTPGLSLEGLLDGSRRVLVLVALMAGVYWLLATTPVPQLVAALDQLLWPLRRLGLSTSVFSRRLALTLGGLDAVEARYRALRADGHRGLDLAGAWILAVERAPPEAAPALPPLAWPAWWEWLLVLLLLLGVLWWPR
jgi:energy-coupling factor transporter transmembrane protein EcfT